MPATTSTDSEFRAALMRAWEFDGDIDESHKIYHDDAILEFPQSGERFVGVNTFREWRRQYPAKLRFRVRRVMGHGPLWAGEQLISYDGGPWMFGVSLYQFRDDRIAREVVYVMDGWDAPEWRRPWATTFDPLASVAPSEWREGVPFGIDEGLEANLG